MKFMRMFIDAFGFDPTQLAGRPTGYALAYAILFILSTIIGSGLLKVTKMCSAKHPIAWCLVGIVLGLIWVTSTQHLLLVEYPGKSTIAPDTGVKETYIVPVPLPVLRSRQFPFPVGSPAYSNAEPWTYEAEGLKPENVLATFATIALHWLGLLLLMSCLIAVFGIMLKSQLSGSNVLFRRK